VQKDANKNVAATRDFDGSGQQASTASSQPATQELSATVSPSTSPPAAKSLPASNKLWGLIPDQTTGVAGMAVMRGDANHGAALDQFARAYVDALL
jgi:hypothetical protein